MQLILVVLALPNAPDGVRALISDFLVADIPLMTACRRSALGSVALLDLVWRRSLRDVDSDRWTMARVHQGGLDEFSSSQFTYGLMIAIGRADLTMLQWLLTHFPDAAIATEVVDAAAEGCHLWALQAMKMSRNREVLWKYWSVRTAAEKKHWDLAMWLLKQVDPARRNREMNTDLVFTASKQDDFDRVNRLLTMGFGVGYIDFSSTGEWRKRSELVRDLLDRGLGDHECLVSASVNQAAQLGDLEFVQWIVSQHISRDGVVVVGRQYYVTSALEKAAESGQIPVVQWLISCMNDLAIPNGPSDAMFTAAQTGRLDVVRWLHEAYFQDLGRELYRNHTGHNRWDLLPTAVMDATAARGHLDILQFLHDIDVSLRESFTETSDPVSIKEFAGLRCTTMAMDAAAENGHLSVVKWLHENRSEVCTPEAIDQAAGKGHLEVVKWLSSHRSEGCSFAAVDKAAARQFHLGHLHVTLPGCCAASEPKAFARTQFEIVKILQEKHSKGCTSAAIDGAASVGNLEMLQWLRENTTVSWTGRAMEDAAATGRLDIVQWLYGNGLTVFYRQSEFGGQEWAT